jgi:hypothetical protein
MRILGYILVVLFVTTSAMGQQINPVPDYIFRYQMSVGRNAPTDTAAYLSVGPRYGANKGLMPPMVVDTNAVTGVKRNGLLIFSVQLNNFAYWDSTTSRFRKITAEAVVDSVVFATRAWRKKGDDSLGAVISQRTDTALLSTKAYRQKGVDSLVTLISTLGGGTVLSVSAGTGMNFTTITTSGSVNADTNVLATRANRDKLKDSLQAIIAGKVNISDTSTMLSAYLRKADTTSMLSPYLRKTDTTAMLTPYVRIAGFGLTKGTQALSVDSALMATRARVQKGIDSVASLVTTTDSVLFSTRAWRQKGVDSVAALANTKATATGTTNYLSKFTGTSSLGNSIVYATTSEVGISTPSPTHPLDVNGRVRVRTIDSTATGMNMLYADVDGVIKKAAPPAGGTVTSVSAGTGMSFTTITSTGSVSADTVALATRAWRQKGIDSVANVRVGGSGTTNYVPKFTASGTIGNSQIIDDGTNVAIGTTSFNNKLTVKGGNASTLKLDNGGEQYVQMTFERNTASNSGADILLDGTGGTFGFRTLATYPITFSTSTSAGSPTERMRLTAAGRLLVGTTTEGTNTVDIAGTLRSTQGANFATSSGNVGIGTESPSTFGKLGIAVPDLTSKSGIGFGTNHYGSVASPKEIAMLEMFSIAGTAPAGISSLNSFNDNSGNWLAFKTTNNAGTTATRMTINNAGNLGIGTTSPSEVLHVVGRARVTTIDSSASPINMLWADVNGVIRKTAVPASVVGSGNTNYIPKWTNATALGNSVMYEQGGEITVGSTTDFGAFTLQVDGTQYVKTSLAVGTTSLLADADVQIGATSGNDGYLQIAAASNGIAQISFGDGTGNDRFAGYMAYYHQGDSLVMGTASTQRFTLNATGLGLGTAPAERLDVNGRARVRTIDSSASPINMLWADNNGVIRKAAVPAGGGGGVTSVSAGTGMSFSTITSTGSVSADTSVLSTRAWRNKAIDTLIPLIAAKGSGTVTSVATGFGIDGGTITSTGTLTADTVEMATRVRVQKGIDSVGALARVTGSGTTNYVPLWTGSTALGNSSIYEASSEVLIGTTSDAGAFKLQISGVTYSSDGLRTGNPNGGTAATWKLGSRIAGSYSTASAYLEVDIGGTLYYIGLVTPD